MVATRPPDVAVDEGVGGAAASGARADAGRGRRRAGSAPSSRLSFRWPSRRRAYRPSRDREAESPSLILAAGSPASIAGVLPAAAALMPDRRPTVGVDFCCSTRQRSEARRTGVFRMPGRRAVPHPSKFTATGGGQAASNSSDRRGPAASRRPGPPRVYCSAGRRTRRGDLGDHPRHLPADGTMLADPSGDAMVSRPGRQDHDPLGRPRAFIARRGHWGVF